MTEKQTAVAFLEWANKYFVLADGLYYRGESEDGFTASELFDIFMIQKHYTNGSLNKRATNG